MNSLTNIQGLPCGCESLGVTAHKNDGVTISGTCNGHLDSCGSAGLGGNFNLVQLTKQCVCVSRFSEQANTGVSGVASGVIGEVSNNNSHTDLLSACSDDGNREGCRSVALKNLSVEIHINWSGKKVPIDWAAMGCRRVRAVPDASAA